MAAWYLLNAEMQILHLPDALFCLATECGSRMIPLIMKMVDPDEERLSLTKFYAEMSEGELLKVCSDTESLTEVALQVLRSEFERRGMDTALFDSGAATDTVEYRELTMIRRFRDLPEALLAKTSLESTGIECFLADENIVRIDWFWSNLLGGAKLHVRTEDADAALEILGQPVPEGFEVEGVGQFERPCCPNCNSVDIYFDELRPIGFVGAYFGLLIPLHRNGWKCHSCGHQWRDEEET
jgi:hypothetical protein